ncbi:heterokaryon incompatibility protein-domain-containing protein [Podospora conica]|nr:heterokaryon incompatibility protein-domain-containing protein [Schizothecium conicum]
MATTYVYHPLDKSKNEIRVVDILPSADFNAPIELSITHVPFVVPPEHLLADNRQPLDEIYKTLPAGWGVEKTSENRHIYLNESPAAGGDIRTSWTHPGGLDFGEPPRLPPAGFKPQFEALSWTWGEQVNTETAWARDSRHSRSLYRLGQDLTRAISQLRHPSRSRQIQLRQNLAEAIRHLRQPSQSRRMWIDSICIDQENTDERGDQVLRMKDIYRLAERVVIWLGPAGRDTQLAFESLRCLGERVESTQRNSCLPPPTYTGDYPWLEPDCGMFLPVTTWGGLDDLFGREWFGRVWTIQESLLANSDSTFQCGRFTLPFGSCLRVCATLGTWDDSTTPFNMHRLLRAIQRMSLRDTSFFRILCYASEMACSNPRDKVYGVLGLMPRCIMGGMRPNYSLGVSEVFGQTVIQHGTAGRRLGLLDHCNLGSKLPDAPSWCPNYTIPEIWADFAEPRSLASGYFPSSWTSKGDGVLGVDAVRHGTVAQVSPSLESKQSMFTFCWEAYQGHLEGISKGAHARNYAYAANLGLLDELYPEAGFPTLAQATDKMLDILSNNAAPTGYNRAHYLFNGTPLLLRLLFTSGGLVGLASCPVQPEDLVVVILGCRTPKIVRPLLSPPGINTTYQLVGSCDILGLSNAEALLGPLPPGYRVRYYRDSVGCNQAWFVNDETGATLKPFRDPRLEPPTLPVEWDTRELSGEGEEGNDGFPLYEFSNRETGEVTRIDPRCTREALIARGVTLETFDLE